MAMIGRLKPGVTAAQAQAETHGRIAAQITREHPRAQHASRATSSRWPTRSTAGCGLALWVLAGAVGVVMLIVCANLSNLLLARTAARQKEIAIRTALGAGRGRLVAQMLTEGIVLSCSGAVLGIAARDRRHARAGAARRGERAAAAATSTPTRGARLHAGDRRS